MLTGTVQQSARPSSITGASSQRARRLLLAAVVATIAELAVAVGSGTPPSVDAGPDTLGLQAGADQPG